MNESAQAETLWNASPWWTRTGAILGFIVIAMGIVMGAQLGAHLGPCGLPNGVTKPGLAIELAGDADAGVTIVGPCSAGTCRQVSPKQVDIGGGKVMTVCLDKVDALRAQQWTDYFFIPAYWALFVWIAILSLRFGGIRFSKDWAQFTGSVLCKAGGAGTLVFATAGAVWDYIEDARILSFLSAVRNAANSGAGALLSQPGMRAAAFNKWLCLFVAIGCTAPFFLFWPGATAKTDDERRKEKKSLVSLFLAWAAGFSAISAAFTGLAAYLFMQDQRVEAAAGSLFLALLLGTVLMVVAQSWPIGTQEWLDRLTMMPVLRRIPMDLDDRQS